MKNNLSIRHSLLAPVFLFFLFSCELEVIPPDNGITAGFTHALTNDCNGTCTVQFTNTSQNAETFEWSFGDAAATTSAEENPVFSYGVSGEYSVTVRAIRGEESDEETSVITITVENPTGGAGAIIQHIASESNTAAYETELDDALLNDNENAIVVVSTALGSNFARNASPVAVQYNGNRWRIRNLNTAENIATGVVFNILVKNISDSHAFMHTATSSTLSSSYTSTMDHPELNNNPAARVFVTPRRDGTTSIPDSPVGVVYRNNRWEIINLDTFKPIVEGTRYNVFIDDNDGSSFTHVASLASISGDLTSLDYATLNANPNLKLIITPSQGTSATPVLNPRAPGAWYDAVNSKWTVFNQNGDEMPFNSRYNVYATQ